MQGVPRRPQCRPLTRAEEEEVPRTSTLDPAFPPKLARVPRWLKIVVAVLVAAGAIAALRLLPIGPWLIRFQEWVRGAGAAGPFLYAVGYGVIALILPGSLLTIGAGALFGVLIGTIVVDAGATLAATLAFLLARTVLRERIERKIAGNEKFQAIDRAIAREGTRIVLLVRLAAVFPFTLVNYAFGLTAIRLLPYIAATAIGILPGTLAFVWIGAAGAAAATQSRTRLLFTLAGVAAALAVSVFIAKIAQKEIGRAGGVKSEE